MGAWVISASIIIAAVFGVAFVVALVVTIRRDRDRERKVRLALGHVWKSEVDARAVDGVSRAAAIESILDDLIAGVDVIGKAVDEGEQIALVNRLTKQ